MSVGRSQLGAIFALNLVMLVLVGCLLADRARPDVTDLSAMLPTLQELAVDAYMSNDDCEYLSYERGAFSANLDDDSCGWILGEPPPPSLGAFDEQARSDLASIKGAFAKRGIPISFMALTRRSDGSIARATFSADRCVDYQYEPGWTSLPEAEKDTVTAINANWWKSDSCS